MRIEFIINYRHTRVIRCRMCNTTVRLSPMSGLAPYWAKRCDDCMGKQTNTMFEGWYAS